MLKIKDNETFVNIKGYDGRYKVGNKGTVIGISRSNDNRYKDKQWALKTGRFDNMKELNSERMKNNPLNGYIYAIEITKKKVKQYDKSNDLIASYESISEASRKTGITITSISYSCNKKRKTGGGYIWHFA